MEMVIYTIAALLLYGISDYILNAIEVKMEKRLPNRSLVFFAIITILAISSFSVIKVIYKGTDATQPTNNDQATQGPPTASPPQSVQATNPQSPVQPQMQGAETSVPQ